MKIEDSLRALIREEVARLVKPDALTREAPTTVESELREKASASAARLRRARGGS